MFGRSLLAPIVLAVGLLASAGAAAAPNLCTPSIVEAERAYGIPEGLLLAMAVQESGVNGRPHPWALNLGGRVVYASSIDAAQRILGERRAKGRKNLYAGCMQLSVFHHGGAFGSLRDLLQPQRNVAYAARYLAGHYEDYGDWQAAVRRYQGGKARQSAAYLCRVLRTLAEIRPETARRLDTGRCGPPPSIAVRPDAEAEPAREPLSREDLRELT
jgi:soluble lytic murein transglycosylase-like protein